MENWTKTGYEMVKTLKRGSATIIIHRPNLDEKERARRESRVKTAACQMLVEMDKQRKKEVKA